MFAVPGRPLHTDLDAIAQTHTLPTLNRARPARPPLVSSVSRDSVTIRVDTDNKRVPSVKKHTHATPQVYLRRFAVDGVLMAQPPGMDSLPLGTTEVGVRKRSLQSG